jgi:hypothetical protein
MQAFFPKNIWEYGLCLYFVQNKLWRIYSFKLVANLNHKTLHVQSERDRRERIER